MQPTPTPSLAPPPKPVAVCAWCNKVRDTSHCWHPADGPLAIRVGRPLPPGICPDCNRQLTSRPQAAQQNRRIFRRRPSKGSTKVTCRRGGLGLVPNLAACLLDLSETGAGLVTREPLAKGQEVELGFLGLGHTRPVLVLAEVVRCAPGSNGTYHVGFKFQHYLRHADVLELA